MDRICCCLKEVVVLAYLTLIDILCTLITVADRTGLTLIVDEVLPRLASRAHPIDIARSAVLQLAFLTSVVRSERVLGQTTQALVVRAVQAVWICAGIACIGLKVELAETGGTMAIP